MVKKLATAVLLVTLSGAFGFAGLDCDSMTLKGAVDQARQFPVPQASAAPVADNSGSTSVAEETVNVVNAFNERFPYFKIAPNESAGKSGMTFRSMWELVSIYHARYNLPRVSGMGQVERAYRLVPNCTRTTFNGTEPLLTPLCMAKAILAARQLKADDWEKPEKNTGKGGCLWSTQWACEQAGDCVWSALGGYCHHPTVGPNCDGWATEASCESHNCTWSGKYCF
jgi:hypothetical protein